MPKGIYTQSVAVLLTEPVALEPLADLLADRTILGIRPGQATTGWMSERRSLLVDLAPKVNGKVVIDVVDQPWPDHMGDAASEPELFAAWTFGFLAPFAYPGNLARAVAHNTAWPDAGDAAGRHRAFIRVRSSCVIGAGPDAKVLPFDYDAEAELETVTRIAHALLAVPPALAYFNPAGEVLLPADKVKAALTSAFDDERPPFELWANIRAFTQEQLTVMDTVGMRQLDLDDQEACFRAGRYTRGEISTFLDQAAFFLLDREMANPAGGQAPNGPGGFTWLAEREEALNDPPRPTMRWLPVDGTTPDDLAP